MIKSLPADDGKSGVERKKSNHKIGDRTIISEDQKEESGKGTGSSGGTQMNKKQPVMNFMCLAATG